MNTRPFARLLLVGLFTLLTTPAFAAQPEFETIEVDTPPRVLTACAGFDVLIEEHGRIKISTHVDQNGDPVKEIARYNIYTTLTNMETGESIVGPTAGIDKVTFQEDGSIRVAASGRGTIFLGNGEQLVFQGRIVFIVTPDGETTVISRSGNFQDLCAALR